MGFPGGKETDLDLWDRRAIFFGSFDPVLKFPLKRGRAKFCLVKNFPKGGFNWVGTRVIKDFFSPKRFFAEKGLPKKPIPL